jgi:hypothetical protein
LAWQLQSYCCIGATAGTALLAKTDPLVLKPATTSLVLLGLPICWAEAAWLLLKTTPLLLKVAPLLIMETSLLAAEAAFD